MRSGTARRQDTPHVMQEERLLILQMVAEKKITVEEAAELLRALEGESGAPAAAPGAPAGAGEPGAPAGAAAPATPAGAGEPGAPAGTPPPGAQAGPGAPPPPPAPPPPFMPHDRAERIRARIIAASSVAGERVEQIMAQLGGLLSFNPGIEYREELAGALETEAIIPVELITGNGRVCVYGWDRPAYKAVITRRVRAATEEEARQRGAELAPFTAGAGGIRFHGRENWDHLQMASLDLYVPAALAYRLTARAGNGRVEAEGISGPEALVKTGNGRVRVEGGRWDRVEARTGNGSVLVRADLDHCVANTGNGSIEVALQGRHSARVDASSGNGSITLDTRGAAGAAFQVEASTGVGGIRCRLEDWESHHSHDHVAGKKVQGTTRGWAGNPAQVTLKARAGVGTITIE